MPAGKKNSALLTIAYWADALPGILNWSLDGLARLRSQGRFTRSAKCDALKGQTRMDSNPAPVPRRRVRAHRGRVQFVQLSCVYDDYREWCLKAGLKHPLTSRSSGPCSETCSRHRRTGREEGGRKTPRCGSV